ncbi:uncharacterized protein Bfra_007461 [Botrytis fragariae]|uniref:BTB domain-containing protein n=1 Tax=Botrytis fragariae TaxID=1964551 RepID=A0A8H6AJ17_9HELO|nr:uncharacterized protein Bfra_007461 [Botrytis fragariae]KAF5868264.1 hypothetical protein Bfra_007461 [Botrytis fragariae]
MSRKRSHSDVSSGYSTTSEDKDCANSENLTSPFFVDSVGSEMVDIHVGRGKEKKLFRVHKKRICTQSSYFKECFKNGKKVTKLPFRSPKLFDMIIEWVYTGNLHAIEDTTPHSTMYSLYQLAEFIELPAAMDNIMDLIRSRHYEKDFYIGARSVEDIYNNTCLNSQLRAYAIELFVYNLRGDTDEKEEVIPNHAVSSLLGVSGFTDDFISLSREITIEDPRKSGCRFHVHGEDDVCGETEDTDEFGDDEYVWKAASDDEFEEDEDVIGSDEGGNGTEIRDVKIEVDLEA